MWILTICHIVTPSPPFTLYSLADTDLVLDPGGVARRSHDELNEAGAQQHQQQDGSDVLPHVKVEPVRSEAQHVLQVFKKPETERPDNTDELNRNDRNERLVRFQPKSSELVA